MSLYHCVSCFPWLLSVWTPPCSSVSDMMSLLPPHLLFFSIPPPWPHPYLIRWVRYPQLFFFSTPPSMTTIRCLLPSTPVFLGASLWPPPIIHVWYEESVTLHSCFSRFLSPSSSGFDTMSVTLHSCQCISLTLICIWYDGICLLGYSYQMHDVVLMFWIQRMSGTMLNLNLEYCT